MPTARTARTAARILQEIDGLVEEKDAAAAGYKAKLRALNQEYDTVVAKEAAQKKLDQMSETEKAEFANLLGSN